MLDELLEMADKLLTEKLKKANKQPCEIHIINKGNGQGCEIKLVGTKMALAIALIGAERGILKRINLSEEQFDLIKEKVGTEEVK